MAEIFVDENISLFFKLQDATKNVNKSGIVGKPQLTGILK